ncbi:MAG: serine protease [Chloroflexi bacterium HGW-Chloroflexi-6]|nr:MAG: serine protease [Chloroflexi bacterium HGW-Chloroflexi-6]
MESWLDIQREFEIAGQQRGVPIDFDSVRRSSYSELVAITGRPLIVYASSFHVPIKNQIAGAMLSLDLSDKDGFQEVIQNIDSQSVDIWLHSPGGSAEATESIVAMLRAKFTDVRFIITGTAKSAATMLAMSGNSILMSSAGELGPTDPQLFVGTRFAPAGAILDQFNMAKDEIAQNPNLIGPWLPIMQQFGPSLLVECNNYINLSKKLVSGWLENYMFAGQVDAKEKSERLAEFLANDKNFFSHGRRVAAADLQAYNANISRVEDCSQEVQRAISRVHLTIMATLDQSSAVKLFENSSGGVFIRMVQAQPGNMPMA